jgi:hypothetical protein
MPKKANEDNGEYITKGRNENPLKLFYASIDEVTEWFKQYQVESIELWISGMIETGGVTRLIVSAKGEGGLRVMLKPKPVQV